MPSVIARCGYEKYMVQVDKLRGRVINLQARTVGPLLSLAAIETMGCVRWKPVDKNDSNIGRVLKVLSKKGKKRGKEKSK